MLILFCCDPLEKKKVDADYIDEYNAATGCGLFEAALIDLEALVDENDPIKSVRKIAVRDKLCPAIYRGWMLKPQQYKLLFEALYNKNVVLVNSPQQYEDCHYIPGWYSIVEGNTPKSIIVTPDEFYDDFDSVKQKLKVFGNKPLIVKDYVKSRKHEWYDSCYIPDATKYEEVKRVTNNFITRQGEDLSVGVVYREFVDLYPIGKHPKSGMPLTREYRAFFYKGQLIASYPYWNEVKYIGSDPIDHIKYLKQFSNLNSNFYTVDYALAKNGSLLVIEIGDGQVSGLPGTADKRSFYAWLYHYINSDRPVMESFPELTSVCLKDGTNGTIVYVFPCMPPMYMLDLKEDNNTIDVTHDQIEKVIKV